MVLNLEIKTNHPEEIVDVTALIAKTVLKEDFQEGILLVFNPHTTAGLTINENADPDVKDDILKGLNSLGFENLQFKHFEGNSSAHLKTTLVGNHVELIVQNNELLLGTWQGIYFCEFDGPRTRKLKLKFIKG